MRLLAISRRSGDPFRQGTLAYLVVNLGLVAAELQWHLLYRLTLWDVSQFRSLAPLVGKLIHLSAILSGPVV